jgi:GNAT superfamily N-acetyltransferase
VSRTRSEYLLSLPGELLEHVRAAPSSARIRGVRADDRDALAALLLDAYRGTVDDEGEGDDEARDAIDEYLGRIVWPHSVVLEERESLIAMSFVVIVEGRHYIDPVATASDRKGEGIGRAVVLASLRSLADDGIAEVGAVITDGNTPSERLFARLGFVRVGTWR